MSAKEPYQKPPVKAWEYTIAGKWIVLAGKTDADNDRLSLKEARPNDWWFHVRGMPGSHVILQVGEGGEPDREAFKTAASIAAFHSKAILERVNLWENYGKHYRVTKERKKSRNPYSIWPPAPLEPGEVALGFQQQTNRLVAVPVYTGYAYPDGRVSPQLIDH